MSAPPLAGLVVVDLSRVLAGPFCTLLLRDLGARVIKIERPEQGDDSRQIGPFVGDRSAYFLSLNRGKESIALDLRDGADRELFLKLAGRADVLVENFRPGVMTRLGLGWDTLHTRFPKLIYAATSGFGQSGPAKDRAAYDMVVQAMGGIMSITGHPDGPPTRVGTSIGDLSAGLFTALGIVSALRSRDRDGVGSFVDVAMLDCQVALLENAIARFAATGHAPQPMGSRHPSIAPFGAFETRDGHLVIAAGNDALFRALLRVLGNEALGDDPRFRDNPGRAVHADALKTELERLLAANDTASWLEQLIAAGVPCGPIQQIDDVLRDPQILARNMVVQVEDPEIGPFPVAGNPIKLSGVADPSERPTAPTLDGDRDAILRWLGDSR